MSFIFETQNKYFLFREGLSLTIIGIFSLQIFRYNYCLNILFVTVKNIRKIGII